MKALPIRCSILSAVMLACFAMVAQADEAVPKITGHVFNTDNKIASGADVYLYVGDVQTGEAMVGHTDTQGDFSFEVKPSKVQRPFVYVAGPNHTAGWCYLNKLEGNTVQLQPATDLAIRFTDHSGLSASRTRIRIDQINVSTDAQELFTPPLRDDAPFTGVTNDRGEIVFRNLPVSHKIWLDTDDERFDPLKNERGEITLESDAITKGRTIQLVQNKRPAASRSVQGVTLNPKGEPVGSAKLWIVPMVAWKPPIKATSSKDGTFQFDIDPSIEVEIWAQSDEYSNGERLLWRYRRSGMIKVPLDKFEPVPITGHLSASTGKPLAGIQVKLLQGIGGSFIERLTATTDEKGNFQIDNAPPNVALQLSVNVPGFAGQTIRIKPLRTGQTAKLSNIILKQFDRTIAGKVIAEDGRPMVDAKINAQGKLSGTIVTETDETGSFRIPALAGDRIKLTVHLNEEYYIEQTATAGDQNVILDARAKQN